MQSIVNLTRIVLFSIVFSCCCLSSSSAAPATSNSSDLEANLVPVENCVLKSVFSFLYREAYLPKTIESLKNYTCPTQVEGFKCLKEKSRPLPAILKRGSQTLLSIRQKHHKKYCGSSANLAQQMAFVEAGKCLMEKKFAAYEKLDAVFANTMIAIKDKNFKDSGLELKYLCCNILNYKKGYINNAEPECTANKPYIEEVINTIIPNDLSILCDDDESFVNKVCPSLEKLKVSDKFIKAKGNSPSVLSLYLIATLGEPAR